MHANSFTTTRLPHTTKLLTITKSHTLFVMPLSLLIQKHHWKRKSTMLIWDAWIVHNRKLFVLGWCIAMCTNGARSMSGRCGRLKTLIRCITSAVGKGIKSTSMSHQLNLVLGRVDIESTWKWSHWKTDYSKSNAWLCELNTRPYYTTALEDGFHLATSYSVYSRYVKKITLFYKTSVFVGYIWEAEYLESVSGRQWHAHF